MNNRHDNSKVDDQTDIILKTLCQEIRDHHNEFSSNTDNVNNFGQRLLAKKRKEKVLKRKERHEVRRSVCDIEFEMDGIPNSPSTSSELDLNMESFGSESSFDESLSEEDAIQAIIVAINRMAEKVNNDPNISKLLKKSLEYQRNSTNFSTFSHIIKKLLEDAAPGIAVDSWGNAVFLMIIALKVAKMTQYPFDFFKQYVYDKIVPWVKHQPNGWMSARYDDKIGIAVERAAEVVHPISSSQFTNSPDVAESPSSLLNWFSFARRWSYSDTSGAS